MTAFPKSGRLESEAYLGFVRAQGCTFCPAPPPSHAHHWPPKGRGVTDDSRTIPVCATCHQRCHGITVATEWGRRPPVPAAEQREAVHDTLREFLRDASGEQLEAFLTDLRRWRARRGHSPLVTW